MNRGNILVVMLFFIVSISGYVMLYLTSNQYYKPLSFTAQERGFEEIVTRRVVGSGLSYEISDLMHWKRPNGPLRVGIQVGHWQIDDIPEELTHLKDDGLGAEFNDLKELDVVYKIAIQVKKMLVNEKIEVDLLPATIPSGYIADAFVAIHADLNEDSSISGRKIISPHRDYSGNSIFLEEFVREEYKWATDIDRDSNVTKSIRGYYAFNWYKYKHSVHPMTPAIIVVIGFLSNDADRSIIVDQSEKVAEGISKGVLRFLLSRFKE